MKPISELPSGEVFIVWDKTVVNKHMIKTKAIVWKERVPVLPVILFIIVLFSVSCREECGFVPRVQTVVNFHSLVNGTDFHFAVDSLSVRGIGREDSLLYAGVNNIRTISLPMNAGASESGFIIDFNRGTDTVWFAYNVVPLFLSPECGFIFNFDLLETRHTMNVIDSVVIVTREITIFDETNVRIYN